MGRDQFSGSPGSRMRLVLEQAPVRLTNLLDGSRSAACGGSGKHCKSRRTGSWHPLVRLFLRPSRHLGT